MTFHEVQFPPDIAYGASGGPEYCTSCADAGLPCSKGEPNKDGELCPYCANEPQTMEGWEAWDVALRCAGQPASKSLIALNAAANDMKGAAIGLSSQMDGQQHGKRRAPRQHFQLNLS